MAVIVTICEQQRPPKNTTEVVMYFHLWTEDVTDVLHSIHKYVEVEGIGGRSPYYLQALTSSHQQLLT